MFAFREYFTLALIWNPDFYCLPEMTRSRRKGLGTRLPSLDLDLLSLRGEDFLSRRYILRHK